MNIRPKKAQNASRKQPLPNEHHDILAALEEAESREKARLKTNIRCEVAEQVMTFLKQKALKWRSGVTLLISYGLSNETPEELKKLESQRELDLNWLPKTYATMRFRMYEYFEVNRVLTMKLRSMLSENRLLKQAVDKAGLCNKVTTDEGESWSEATVDGYYRKYVFRSQT